MGQECLISLSSFITETINIIELYFSVDFLGKKLEDYVANLPVKVKVIRMGKRGGLIRARLKGEQH